jgi:hypothetical protein
VLGARSYEPEENLIFCKATGVRIIDSVELAAWLCRLPA